MTLTKQTRSGLAFGIGGYLFWGVVALYFKLVQDVAPLEILAHRIVWSVAVLLIIIAVSRRWASLRLVIISRRSLRLLGISALLVAVNWLVFIWAVTRDHLVDASLGYFLNPLVNILLGFLFLRERLKVLEWVSVGLAASGVAWLIGGAGMFPWISLTLALTFGLYGLVRKIVAVTSIEGLAVETALLLPLALGYLIYRARTGSIAFGQSPRLDVILVAAGPVTALPLLLFASAVRRLRLATVGLLQYIAPTMQFVLAVAVFNEPFGRERLVAFVLIWSAIVVYSYANLMKVSGPRPQASGDG